MGTLVVGIIVFGCICLAVYKIYKDHKNGKGCGAGCDNCSARSDCAKSDSSK